MCPIVLFYEDGETFYSQVMIRLASEHYNVHV